MLTNSTATAAATHAPTAGFLSLPIRETPKQRPSSPSVVCPVLQWFFSSHPVIMPPPTIRSSSIALAALCRTALNTASPLARKTLQQRFQYNSICGAAQTSRRTFRTSAPAYFHNTTFRMGVHDVASYVKYHQQKLREEQAQSSPRRVKTGVDSLNSKAEFQQAISGGVTPQGESHDGQVVFLDAYATWCGPCKAIAPTIAEWSNSDKYKGKVAFYKFDVDQVSDLAQELGVRAMPTFFIFKGGELEPVETVVGANPKALEAAIDKVVAA